MANFGLQRLQPLGISSALGARQRDVGTVRAILWDESARDDGFCHSLLERQQFRREGDAHKEDSRSVEVSQFVQFN